MVTLTHVFTTFCLLFIFSDVVYAANQDQAYRSAFTIMARSMQNLFLATVERVLEPSHLDINYNLWSINNGNPLLSWKQFPIVPESTKAGPLVSGVRTLVKRSTTAGSSDGNYSAPLPYHTDIELDESMIKYVDGVYLNRKSSAMSDPSLPDLPSNETASASANATTDRVLMVSFTSNGIFKNFNSDRPVQLKPELWLTAYPQLKQFCQYRIDHGLYSANPMPGAVLQAFKLNPADRSSSSYDNIGSVSSYLTLRVLQYLGLAPVLPSKRRWIVSMWVDPRDLLRPCPDTSIENRNCSLSYIVRRPNGQFMLKPPSDTSTASSTNIASTSEAWFDGMLVSSGVYKNHQSERYGDLTAIFPWTRLGYTYDYADQGNHMGASEFVLRSGSTVWVDSVQELTDYCLPL